MAKYLGYVDGGKTSEKGLSRFTSELISQSGVFTGLNAQAASSPDKTVRIQAGSGLIADSDYVTTKGDYYYYYWLTSEESVTIQANTSGNDRIDTIVSYVDLSDTSTADSDNPATIKIIAVEGTPAGSPTAPSDATIQTAVGASNPWFKLADVEVADGFSAITNSDITDRRRYASPAILNGGWSSSSETWTYASATTFTISGDKTDKYSKGDKIRFKQGGGYKYFYVVSVTYSSPNTTVTVTGGSTYTIANSAITDNYYSKNTSPVGFPVLIESYVYRNRALTGSPDINGDGTEVDWTDWNLQSIVGTQAVKVHLWVRIQDDNAASYFAFRKKGQVGATFGVDIIGCRATDTANVNSLDIWVECDSDQIIEYKIEDAGGSAITSARATVVGWMEKTNIVV